MARTSEMASLKATALLAALASVAGENPYTTNVVALTPRNFRELQRSNFLWFVNICRHS